MKRAYCKRLAFRSIVQKPSFLRRTIPHPLPALPRLHRARRAAKKPGVGWARTFARRYHRPHRHRRDRRVAPSLELVLKITGHVRVDDVLLGSPRIVRAGLFQEVVAVGDASRSSGITGAMGRVLYNSGQRFLIELIPPSYETAVGTKTNGQRRKTGQTRVQIVGQIGRFWGHVLSLQRCNREVRKESLHERRELVERIGQAKQRVEVSDSS